MHTIAVVEDEPQLRSVLSRLLSTAGYHVRAFGTGADALALVMATDVDMVLLDLNLPDMRGEDVLRVLQATKPHIRTVVLSSASEIGRRIAVLESGAQDFVAKPFVNAELLARIKLRLGTGHEITADERVEITDDVVLDVARRELVIGASRVPLSQREFTLLNHLIHRRGRVCTRQELLADVWGMQFDPGTNVVDVCVRRLRAKLAGNAIETVRNVGYRLIAS